MTLDIAAIKVRANKATAMGTLDAHVASSMDVPTLINALEASEAARVKAEQEQDATAAEFKNFHRMLCKRFDCHVHDEIDWKRDQVSLMEAIAKRITDLEQGRDALRNFVADFADTNIAMLPMPHIKHPADEPDKAVSAAEVWEWQNDASRALEANYGGPVAGEHQEVLDAIEACNTGEE